MRRDMTIEDTEEEPRVKARLRPRDEEVEETVNTRDELDEIEEEIIARPAPKTAPKATQAVKQENPIAEGKLTYQEILDLLEGNLNRSLSIIRALRG